VLHIGKTTAVKSRTFHSICITLQPSAFAQVCCDQYLLML